MGEVQGCHQLSYNTQDIPWQQRDFQPQVSMVSRLRDPDLADWLKLLRTHCWNRSLGQTAGLRILRWGYFPKRNAAHDKKRRNAGQQLAWARCLQFSFGYLHSIILFFPYYKTSNYKILKIVSSYTTTLHPEFQWSWVWILQPMAK